MSPQPTKAASPPQSTQPAAIGGLAAIGDGGQPVNWWFIYKVGTGKPSDPSLKVAVGDEYAYFDSEMARNPTSLLTLSARRIRDAQSALFGTMAQISGPAAKANRALGW